ncbi:MAG: F0F1 ATP synthase subunit A [Candidatus Gottesmanbacteria bacterium]
MLHISLAAETIAHIGSFPITNSLALTWLVMALLFGISLVVSRTLTMVPSHGQSIIESVIEGLYVFFESVVGHHVKMLFPLIASLFLFILTANWIGLLPGVGTIGFFHEAILTPLFRGPTADLNTTIALAIVAFMAIQYFGFRTLGIKYGSRFVNLKNPIMFFVGLLEIISDISKVISFAFRLFGNIFAGEVLLAVMAFLMPFIAPMPFLMLELFVGFIQALVFSTLTAVFVNVAVAHEE